MAKADEENVIDNTLHKTVQELQNKFEPTISFKALCTSKGFKVLQI